MEEVYFSIEYIYIRQLRNWRATREPHFKVSEGGPPCHSGCGQLFLY